MSQVSQPGVVMYQGITQPMAAGYSGYPAGQYPPQQPMMYYPQQGVSQGSVPGPVLNAVPGMNQEQRF